MYYLFFLFLFFFYWEGIYTVFSSLSSHYPMCFWICLQRESRYLVSFTVIFLLLTSLLIKPAVSEPGVRPSAITLKLEAISDSVSGPARQIPLEPPFVFFLMPQRREWASSALCVLLPVLAAEKALVFTPLEQAHVEEMKNALSWSFDGQKSQAGEGASRKSTCS